MKAVPGGATGFRRSQTVTGAELNTASKQSVVSLQALYPVVVVPRLVEQTPALKEYAEVVRGVVADLK